MSQTSENPRPALPADMPVFATASGRGRYYLDDELVEVSDLCRRAFALDDRILKPAPEALRPLTHAVSAHDAAAVLHAHGHHVGLVSASAARVALAEETARLLQITPFNQGWLARSQGLPNRPPADCPQPRGWARGWQTADETPSEHWPWIKGKLLRPTPAPAT